MTEQDDTPPDDIYLAEIAHLTKMVDTGAELVEEGNEINLANLETAVAELCQRMAEAPPADTTKITSAIEQLVERLNTLGEALRHQHETRH